VELGISDPVTSGQQSAVVPDYLKRSKVAEEYNSVADLFQSDVDRRAFQARPTPACGVGLGQTHPASFSLQDALLQLGR
jgi:hypothetical protein